jgi:hypothetical protein
MVNNHQDAVSNRDRSFLRAFAAGKTTILSTQIGVLALASSVGRLDEQPTCVKIAFARLA